MAPAGAAGARAGRRCAGWCAGGANCDDDEGTIVMIDLPIGILGGGLGGLAAAVTLAGRGHRVVLFERSAWLGGKAAVLEEGGYRFDMGPTILTMPSILGRVVAEVGRRLADELELVRLDPQWRCFFHDGSTLDLLADPAAMADRLETFAPGQGLGAGYGDFLAYAQRMHSVSERFFFWRSIGSLRDTLQWRDILQPAVLADVLSMRLGQTVAGAVRRHVLEPRVAQMLDHFTQYVGSAPAASPAVLCGIAHMQTGEGVWYPRGGMRAVADLLARLALEAGVEVRTSTEVRQIVRGAAGQVSAVRTARGDLLPLAALVCNGDSVRSHAELLDGGPPPASRGGGRTSRPVPASCSTWGCSAATITCCTTTSSFPPTPKRSSPASTSTASRRRTPPATSAPRPRRMRAWPRTAARRSMSWSTRPTCERTTTGGRCSAPIGASSSTSWRARPG